MLVLAAAHHLPVKAFMKPPCAWTHLKCRTMLPLCVPGLPWLLVMAHRPCSHTAALYLGTAAMQQSHSFVSVRRYSVAQDF